MSVSTSLAHEVTINAQVRSADATAEIGLVFIISIIFVSYVTFLNPFPDLRLNLRGRSIHVQANAKLRNHARIYKYLTNFLTLLPVQNYVSHRQIHNLRILPTVDSGTHSAPLLIVGRKNDTVKSDLDMSAVACLVHQICDVEVIIIFI